MSLSDFFVERPVLGGFVVCTGLFFALMGFSIGRREAPRQEPRWTSSCSSVDARFSVQLPVRDRQWIRASELPPGLEGVLCRDGAKRAVYTVIFGTPAAPWTPGVAHDFLEGVRQNEPGARIEATEREGRSGFKLTAATSERSTRYEVLLDGPRVVILSVSTAAEDEDTKRFFESLDFSTKWLAAPSLALGR